MDRDTRFLAAGDTAGLSALSADVTAPGFDPGRFQLVHARFVLMHLRCWRRMIATLASLLAPDGVLVLSDAVDLTSAGAPATAYTTVMRAMWQALRETIGTDISWVPDYPYLLREEGLRQVGAEMHAPPLAPGSALSRFWADTWDRSQDAMVATGRVDAAQIARARHELASPGAPPSPPGCSPRGAGGPTGPPRTGTADRARSTAAAAHGPRGRPGGPGRRRSGTRGRWLQAARGRCWVAQWMPPPPSPRWSSGSWTTLRPGYRSRTTDAALLSAFLSP